MTMGQIVGYIRVSSVDQNTDRQLADFKLDKVFTDKASGKSMERPELKRCLDHVREGDTLVVHSMDRLARNVSDLLTIVKKLTDEGVKVHFVKQNLIFTGENDPSIHNLMLAILGAVAQFERDLIRERQREGIAAAKAKGNVFKGRPFRLKADKVAELRRRAAEGVGKSALAREFGISRPSVYRYLEPIPETGIRN